MRTAHVAGQRPDARRLGDECQVLSKSLAGEEPSGEQADLSDPVNITTEAPPARRRSARVAQSASPRGSYDQLLAVAGQLSIPRFGIDRRDATCCRAVTAVPGQAADDACRPGRPWRV